MGRRLFFYFRTDPGHSQNGHLPLKHSIFLEEPKMKKYTVMKKFLTMTLACAMTLSLAAWRQQDRHRSQRQ